MLISYKTKTQQTIDDSGIKATLIEYEITKEDLTELACRAQLNDYSINYFYLQKNNILDIVVDNIDCNRLVEGVIRDNGKSYLDYYVVEKGLKELILTLSLHN